MASRYKDKAQHGPRLRGLERRNSECRRKQARRKSDNGNRPVVPVQQVSTAGKRGLRQTAAGKSPTMSRDSLLLRSVLEQVPTSIMLCDRDLKITFVNRALAEMLLQREAEIRRRFPDIDPRNLVGTGMDRFQSGSGCASMYAEIRVDANFVVELSATALVNPDGECMGRMVVWTEASERKTTDTEVLEVLASMKSASAKQSRDIARLGKTLTRLGEAICHNGSPVERGEAGASVSAAMRRNLRSRRPGSRRILVSDTDD